MADKYAQEAEQISQALIQVRDLLGNEARLGSHQQEAKELQIKIHTMAQGINRNIQLLTENEKQNFYGTDPSLALQRRNLINETEGIKTDFEFDVFPQLEKLIKQLIKAAKENPAAQVNESALEPRSAGEHWTVQKVLDSAGKFVDQAAQAGAIATKAYAVAKALGYIFGIVIP